MLNCEPGLPKTHVELLMDIVTGISDCLQKPADFQRLPAVLARMLDLPALSLAVVRIGADGSAKPLADFSATEPPPFLERDMLEIHRQAGTLADLHGPAIPFRDPTAMDLRPAFAYQHQRYFSHAINERHYLLLVVHMVAGAPPLAAGMVEILQLVTRQLGRSLACLLLWMENPKALGKPFARISESEWMVFHGLCSDASEKQMADQMHISHHTVHSHIKSIYRKVGVQGRLPLMRRAEKALHDLRLNCIHAGCGTIFAVDGPHAIAVG